MLDLSKFRLRGARILTTTPQVIGHDGTQHKIGDGLLYAPARGHANSTTFGVEATVKLIGPDVVDISVGDRVIVNEFAGTPIVVDGTEQPYRLMGVNEVAAVIG